MWVIKAPHLTTVDLSFEVVYPFFPKCYYRASVTTGQILTDFSNAQQHVNFSLCYDSIMMIDKFYETKCTHEQCKAVNGYQLSQ